MTENRLSKNIVSEIHRKVGRLVLLFQKTELLLKDLIARNNVVAKPSELISIYNEKFHDNSKCTLGNLIKKYSESFYKEEHVESEDISINEIIVSHEMSRSYDDCDNACLRLKEIVDSRNFIVHNLLENFETQTIEQCYKLEFFLDEEYRKANNFFEELGSYYDLMARAASYFQTEHFKNKVLNFSNADDLSRLMASDIFEACKREDGWVVLQKAANLLREQYYDLCQDKKQKYGYASIKKIMELSNLFEFKNETTSKGGLRIVYRLTPFKFEE